MRYLRSQQLKLRPHQRNAQPMKRIIQKTNKKKSRLSKKPIKLTGKSPSIVLENQNRSRNFLKLKLHKKRENNEPSSTSKTKPEEHKSENTTVSTPIKKKPVREIVALDDNSEQTFFEPRCISIADPRTNNQEECKLCHKQKQPNNMTVIFVPIGQAPVKGVENWPCPFCLLIFIDRRLLISHLELDNCKDRTASNSLENGSESSQRQIFGLEREVLKLTGPSQLKNSLNNMSFSSSKHLTSSNSAFRKIISEWESDNGQFGMHKQHKGYLCELCGKKFELLENIVNHVSAVHSKSLSRWKEEGLTGDIRKRWSNKLSTKFVN